jgi:hypothetical protein
MAVCSNCGGPLPPRHRKWCGKDDCRKAGDRAYSHRHRGGLAKSRLKFKGELKDHPGRTCQFPPDARHKCGKPLSGTANYFFCPTHAGKVGLWVGIEGGN